jgi:hypothetical protein
VQSVVGGVLSSCLVKQPKNLGDKKSSFLRALRRCETQQLRQVTTVNGSSSSGGDGHLPNSASDTAANHNDQTTQPFELASDANENSVGSCVENLENGDDTREDPVTSNDVFHPGFTETEYRLLLEMGWKEPADDDDGYEITEDDVREFENLRHQLKNNKLNSPLSTPKHNGFSSSSKSLCHTPTSTLSTPNTSRLFNFAAEVPLPCLEHGIDDDSSDDEDSDIDPH